MLDKLQRRVYRTVDPLLAVSLESLADRLYYFGRCLSQLAELGPLPHSRGRFTRYSNRLSNFSVAIPRGYKHVCFNNFFPMSILCLQDAFT